MKRAIKVLLALGLFFLWSEFSSFSYAQSTNTGTTDAPDTQKVIDDCLAAGGGGFACAALGYQLLKDRGYDVTAVCDGPTGPCTLTCDNGATIHVPGVVDTPPVPTQPAPTQPAPTQPPVPTQPAPTPDFPPPDLPPPVVIPSSSPTPTLTPGLTSTPGPTATPGPTVTPGGPTLTPTPTPKVPACNVACNVKADCEGAKDGCVECIPDASGNKTCKKPPACNVTCNVKADCEGAKDGCVECIPDASGNKTCKKPPACNVTCNVKADCEGAKDGCTECIPDASGKKACKEVLPTPTPNPFNQAMCVCDGITLEPSTFIAGQKLTVTAYAKVEGGDTSYATVPNMHFTGEHTTTLGHGVVDSEAIIGTTMIPISATKVRYKAVWNYTVPVNPDPNVTYKIRAEKRCVQKTAGIQSNSRIADIETSDLARSNKNIFSRIFDFILSIFEKKPDSQTSKIQSNSEDTLQLRTFKRGGITGTDYCSYIEFRMK